MSILATTLVMQSWTAARTSWFGVGWRPAEQGASLHNEQLFRRMPGVCCVGTKGWYLVECCAGRMLGFVEGRVSHADGTSGWVNRVQSSA
jgi:hypothetical protein